MKKLLTGVCLCSVLYFISCRMDNGTISNEIDDRLEELIKDHSENGKISFYVMPQSNEYSSIPNQDPNNPITAEKAALGKMLFFETGLAQEAKKSVSFNTYSCSSCHIPEKNFTAGRVQGIADGAIGFGRLGELRHKNPLYDGSEVDAQGARPLPTINLAYVRNALWSGAFGARGMNEGTQSAWGIADSLTSINHLGMEGLESNNTRALFVHRQVITKELMEKLGLKSMFDKAFPNVPDDQRYTRQIASNAIASYFRTIFTNEAPFQKWLKGDRSALSPQQKRGAELFFGKAGCINCHNSPSFNAQRFAAVGVKDLYQNPNEVFRTGPLDARNKGRGGFTLRDADLYKFKVPQLYNLKGLGFYFHGASKYSLREVVEYFNNAIPENPNVPLERIDYNFKPLHLAQSEIDDLVEFLDNGLYDDNLVRYKPDFIMSGLCFPDNDPESKHQMGCL
ncbi:MAG: cytochrome c peroxidase [Saprospiraceae bacterium]